MISIRVGKVADKSPDQKASDAAFVRQLLDDARFVRLLEEYADTATVDWGASRNIEQRERAWTKLEAVKEFVKYLEVVVQRGTPARMGPPDARS